MPAFPTNAVVVLQNSLFIPEVHQDGNSRVVSRWKHSLAWIKWWNMTKRNMCWTNRPIRKIDYFLWRCFFSIFRRNHAYFKVIKSLCLVHTADTDKTRPVSVVWTELETSQDCRRQKKSKLNMFLHFCPVLKCGVNWILSRLDPVSNLQLFSLKYIEDYWKLSWHVANSVHITETDKTSRWYELGISLSTTMARDAIGLELFA